jgi:adenosine/AMP kinase
MNTNVESWENWRFHVLSEIKRANDNFALLTAAVASLHVETAKLQVKSGIWGVIGGMIPVIVVIAIQKIK